MNSALICGAVRTPFARSGGVLDVYNTAQLAALPLKDLFRRNPSFKWDKLERLFLGCDGAGDVGLASAVIEEAGMDRSLHARMVTESSYSGLLAVVEAVNDIHQEAAQLVLASGVSDGANNQILESGWGHCESCALSPCGWASSNLSSVEEFRALALKHRISTGEKFAYLSRDCSRAREARRCGYFDQECMLIRTATTDQRATYFSEDDLQVYCDHPRELGLNQPDGIKACAVLTSGMSMPASGAGAVLLSSRGAAKKYGLIPRARVLGFSKCGGVSGESISGVVRAIKNVSASTGIALEEIDVIELHERSVFEPLAVIRELGSPSIAERININGGDLALGFAGGASGMRLVGTAVNQLQRGGGTYALCAASVGEGVGVAIMLEKVPLI